MDLKNTCKKYTLPLILVLLILRLPFLAGVSLFSTVSPDWLWPTFEIGTYLFTAAFIWYEREALKDFHIDKMALMIILLFKPVAAVFRVSRLNENPSSLPVALILTMMAIALYLALRSTPLMRQRIPRSSIRWLGVGAASGVGLAVLLGYPMSLQIARSEITVKPSLLAWLIPCAIGFVYQLGYAAVTEEPLFRGFLWGYLRKLGWKEGWVWLVQAGLFSLAHLYYLKDAPVSFWLIVPVDALVFGLLAWRSRSIATSMAAHAAVNALGRTVGEIIASYQ